MPRSPRFALFSCSAPEKLTGTGSISGLPLPCGYWLVWPVGDLGRGSEERVAIRPNAFWADLHGWVRSSTEVHILHQGPSFYTFLWILITAPFLLPIRRGRLNGSPGIQVVIRGTSKCSLIWWKRLCRCVKVGISG